jgi:hypothetical protein
VAKVTGFFSDWPSAISHQPNENSQYDLAQAQEEAQRPKAD